MKMKSIVTLLGAGLISFAAISCDSPREDARKDSLENKADAQENGKMQEGHHARCGLEELPEGLDLGSTSPEGRHSFCEGKAGVVM